MEPKFIGILSSENTQTTRLEVGMNTAASSHKYAKIKHMKAQTCTTDLNTSHPGLDALNAAIRADVIRYQLPKFTGVRS